MRHQVAKKSFGRNTAHRLAMFRNMVTSLVEHERIETTLPKAKNLRTLADKMISFGKQGSLHARRQALQVLRTNEAAKKVFDVLAVRFKDRNGGYTRVLRTGFRKGDGAPMAIIEYLDANVKAKPKKKEPKAA